MRKPWVALGAHYDHLGHGENGNSLAGEGRRRQDPPRRRRQRVGHRRGARDRRDARGAAAAAATCCSRSGRARSSGLIGSTAFVEQPPVPLDQLAAYLNFDMVGRMQDNKLTVQATGTQPGVGAA